MTEIYDGNGPARCSVADGAGAKCFEDSHSVARQPKPEPHGAGTPVRPHSDVGEAASEMAPRVPKQQANREGTLALNTSDLYKQNWGETQPLNLAPPAEKAKNPNRFDPHRFDNRFDDGGHWHHFKQWKRHST